MLLRFETYFSDQNIVINVWILHRTVTQTNSSDMSVTARFEAEHYNVTILTLRHSSKPPSQTACRESHVLFSSKTSTREI